MNGSIADRVRWATDYVQYVRERGYLLAAGRFALMTERQLRSGERNAFELGRDYGHESRERTLASPEGLRALAMPLGVLNDVHGTSHTLESLAAACGVDLSEVTEGDVSRMARYIGGTLMGADR